MRDIEGIAYIQLDEADVVRHRLVKSIIRAYDKDKEREEKEEEANREQFKKLKENRDK